VVTASGLGARNLPAVHMDALTTAVHDVPRVFRTAA
jgi:hypothetical protein